MFNKARLAYVLFPPLNQNNRPKNITNFKFLGLLSKINRWCATLSGHIHLENIVDRWKKVI